MGYGKYKLLRALLVLLGFYGIYWLAFVHGPNQRKARAEQERIEAEKRDSIAAVKADTLKFNFAKLWNIELRKNASMLSEVYIDSLLSKDSTHLEFLIKHSQLDSIAEKVMVPWEYASKEVYLTVSDSLGEYRFIFPNSKPTKQGILRGNEESGDRHIFLRFKTEKAAAKKAKVPPVKKDTVSSPILKFK